MHKKISILFASTALVAGAPFAMANTPETTLAILSTDSVTVLGRFTSDALELIKSVVTNKSEIVNLEDLIRVGADALRHAATDPQMILAGNKSIDIDSFKDGFHPLSGDAADELAGISSGTIRSTVIDFFVKDSVLSAIATGPESPKIVEFFVGEPIKDDELRDYYAIADKATLAADNVDSAAQTAAAAGPAE